MLKATLSMAMMHVRTDIFLLFYKKIIIIKNYNNNKIKLKINKKLKNERILIVSLFIRSEPSGGRSGQRD